MIFSELGIAGKIQIPAIILFHLVGRIAAPIMWYFIAEGFYPLAAPGGSVL